MFSSEIVRRKEIEYLLKRGKNQFLIPTLEEVTLKLPINPNQIKDIENLLKKKKKQFRDEWLENNMFYNSREDQDNLEIEEDLCNCIEDTGLKD